MLLTDPTKDKELQTALKAQRVMTVFQASPGGKADQGEVGLEAGAGRQFLVFPKSLRAYAGRPVIGIKYDLLQSAEPARSAPPAKAPKPPKVRKPKESPAAARERAEPEKPKPAAPVVLQRAELAAPESAATVKKKPPTPGAAARSKKLVAFAPAEKEEDEEMARLKKQVRRAMAALEEGKEVAAFNLLKRIVE